VAGKDISIGGGTFVRTKPSETLFLENAIFGPVERFEDQGVSSGKPKT